MGTTPGSHDARFGGDGDGGGAERGQATLQFLADLAPGRVGPVRAVPRVFAVDDDRALVEVRVVDRGAVNRLLAVATITAA